MRRTIVMALAGLMLVSVASDDARAQQVVGHSVSASSREATLTLYMTDGDALRLSFEDGTVRADGRQVGTYTPGGDLESAWRVLLSRSGDLTADQMVEAARRWAPEGIGGEEATALDALRTRFGSLEPMPRGQGVNATIADDVAEAEAALAEAADALEEANIARDAARVIRNELRSSLREGLREGLRETARAVGSAGQDVKVKVRSGSSRVDFGPSPVDSVWGGLLALLGGFLGLGGIAFAASFFGERQLDVAADTVAASFVRSFFVGMFAQPLILPVFGALLVGLALTVVGVLLIPVAVIAFPVALAAAVVLGYLAVARVAGAGWLERRGREYGTAGLPMLKSIAAGLAIVLAIWLPAVLLGWVPVAGTILVWTAAVVTWILATTGFGAMILTRGGLRGSFGRKFAPPPVTPDELFASSKTDITTGEWLAGKAAE